MCPFLPQVIWWWYCWVIVLICHFGFHFPQVDYIRTFCPVLLIIFSGISSSSTFIFSVCPPSSANYCDIFSPYDLHLFPLCLWSDIIFLLAFYIFCIFHNGSCLYLVGSSWLVGIRFSCADFSVASILSQLLIFGEVYCLVLFILVLF